VNPFTMSPRVKSPQLMHVAQKSREPHPPPILTTYLHMILHLDISLLFPLSSRWTVPKRSSHQNSVCITNFPHPSDMLSPYLTVLSVLHDMYNSVSSLLCHNLNCSLASSFLDQNIFLNTLFCIQSSSILESREAANGF
jgi:hypothetical protein